MDRLGASMQVAKSGARALGRAAFWIGSVCLAAGCASTPLPEIPVVPFDEWAYVEDQAPVPGPDLSEGAARDLSENWALIVAGRLGEADLQLAPLRTLAPGDPGVLAAAGFLALRSGDTSGAGELFERALDAAPDDVLASLGALLLILESEDEELLFTRLKRLSELDPDALVVSERLPGLALEVAENRLARARELARSDEPGPSVAGAYRAALEAMPDSADLYLEAAEAAFAAGDRASAREWFETVAANPTASKRQALLSGLAAAELLADGRRFTESLTRLDGILRDPALRGFADLVDRADGLERRLEVARLSERYATIREAERVTREQLAALLAAEIGEPDDDRNTEPVIAIDLERSWAASLIQTAVGAGYLRLFPDHTFKPRALVTRAELAESLAAVFQKFDPQALRTAADDASQLDLSDVPPDHRHRKRSPSRRNSVCCGSRTRGCSGHGPSPPAQRRYAQSVRSATCSAGRSAAPRRPGTPVSRPARAVLRTAHGTTPPGPAPTPARISGAPAGTAGLERRLQPAPRPAGPRAVRRQPEWTDAQPRHPGE